MSKRQTNWHLAAVCALQIDLRDYADVLAYETEHPIGKNYYRIDLLIIRKLSDFPISKAIATDFRKVNLFEIKGIGSGISIPDYYKIHGYAGLYLDSVWKEQHLTARDITLHFLSRRYPAMLLRHLTEDCDFTVEKIAPGIYDVLEAMYVTRFIVTQELAPEDFLYLRCLTNDYKSADAPLYQRLSGDFQKHRNAPVYTNYINELAFANAKRQGGNAMSKTAQKMDLYTMFALSHDEIREQQRKEDEEYYSAKLQEKDDALALMNERITELEAQLAASQH